MNDIIQNILVFTAMALAMSFLIKKYFWKKKAKVKSSSCGTQDCDCH